MGSRGTETDDQATSGSTPEDVAILYSWANLQGAKYRDYSASRREYRAQVRYRAAKAMLERELKAQTEAESSAEAAEREARVAQALAQAHQAGSSSQESRVESLRSAELAALKAAAERVEAARRAEAAAHATVVALREEREIAEAHASAQQQAMIYTEAELRRRQLAGPQPHHPIGEVHAGATAPNSEHGGPRDEFSEHIPLKATAHRGSERADAPYFDFDLSPQSPVLDSEASAMPAGWPFERRELVGSPQSSFQVNSIDSEIEQTSPAWLYASQSRPQIPATLPISTTAAAEVRVGDTLQESRERVAARWLALREVFEHGGPELPAVPVMRPGEVPTPLLAVFSLAGGVGKTSLVATLGRALASKGEKVVLVDTTSHGLLPFYFGAGELRTGVLRAFSPPAPGGEPISLLAYDAAEKSGAEWQQQSLSEDILRHGAGNHRLLLDLSSGSGSSWLMRQMANLHPTVLVPIAPNMNSVISLQAVERLFHGITDSDGRPLLPFYLLNQFDAALPLHLDVREVFRRRLGERLLPFAIRQSPAVAEALAAGMTVVDYAPSEPISQDYFEVASWLRSFCPPATAEFRTLRWGER
jgi:cellulose synthase operon protein YhjQ